MQYKGGNDSTNKSTMYPQLVEFFYLKKALIDLVKEQRFGQLADTMGMPK